MEEVLIALIIVVILFRVSSAWDVSYIRDPSLDDKKCVGTDVDFETELLVGSAIQCVVLCGESPLCKGVFHKRSSPSKCYGCKTVYSAPGGLDTEAETNYYRPGYARYQKGCNPTLQCMPHSNQSCEDTLNVCVCTPGYSYDPSSNTCILTQDCAAYANTYQKHPRKYIPSNNVQVLSSVTLQACMDACSAATTFTCLTLEAGPNSAGTLGCNLQSATARTAPHAFVFDASSTWAYYSRNCA